MSNSKFYEESFKKDDSKKILDCGMYEMPMREIQDMYLINQEFRKLFIENTSEILSRSKAYYTKEIYSIYMSSEGKQAILENFQLFISKLIDRQQFLATFRKDDEIQKRIELFCVKKDDDIKNVKIRYDLILTYMERNNSF